MTTEIKDPVDLHLTPEEFNLVLAGLEALPYRHAKPVIDELSRQVLKALALPRPGLEPPLGLNCHGN